MAPALESSSTPAFDPFQPLGQPALAAQVGQIGATHPATTPDPSAMQQLQRRVDQTLEDYRQRMETLTGRLDQLQSVLNPDAHLEGMPGGYTVLNRPGRGRERVRLSDFANPYLEARYRAAFGG